MVNSKRFYSLHAWKVCFSGLSSSRAAGNHTFQPLREWNNLLFHLQIMFVVKQQTYKQIGKLLFLLGGQLSPHILSIKHQLLHCILANWEELPPPEETIRPNFETCNIVMLKLKLFQGAMVEKRNFNVLFEMMKFMQKLKHSNYFISIVLYQRNYKAWVKEFMKTLYGQWIFADFIQMCYVYPREKNNITTGGFPLVYIPSSTRFGFGSKNVCIQVH